MTPRFVGTPDDFLASFATSSEAEQQQRRVVGARLKNKVRKCAACQKPNAFTLATCNACGHDLSKTELSYTNNVFSGFAFGIEKGPFPFTVSLRHQDVDFLVLDDLLGLTPCHFNAVPTSLYLADWRYLLRNPMRGRALIEQLYARCVDVLRTQFLANGEWRRSVFRDDAASLSDDELVRMAGCGFNYPPSQYQLHLQFAMPPLLPAQFELYERGVHFTHMRFFPLSYVRAGIKIK